MKRLTDIFAVVSITLAVFAIIWTYIILTQFRWEISTRLIEAQTTVLLVVAVAFASVSIIFRLFNKEVSRRRKIVLSVGIVILIAGLVYVRYSGSNMTERVQISSGPINDKYIFTEDWVTGQVTTWSAHLGYLKDKPHVRALEIGSFEGRSAIWFLENILSDPSSSIVCIDVFDGPYESIFDKNTSWFKGRVTKIKAKSQVAVRQLALESFDFVYVDGSHIARDVLLDATLTWDLLKPGGIIIFDDYEWRGIDHGPALLPRPAIDAFLNIFEPYVEVLHKDYQVIVRKKIIETGDEPQPREFDFRGS